jgi:hypothetical protein
MNEASVEMRDVVVVGGGCYGTFYAGQLVKAKARGKARFRTVVIVDRDAQCRARELPQATDLVFVTSEWDAFFDRYLFEAQPTAAAVAADYIVPSPHMSHLMFAWLVRRARSRFPGRAVEVVPVPGTLGTPYDRRAADHTRYVSFADWICPTHCIEPAVCPAIARTREWEMPDAVRALADRLRARGETMAGPALFVCRHHVYGVGAFAVNAVLEGERIVAEAAEALETVDVLVGTVSACHGALNVLRVGPQSSAIKGDG